MKAKKNIVLLALEFPPHTNLGGIARFNHNLARMFADMGHHVYVLTHADKMYGTEISQKNLTIVYVPFQSKHRIYNFLYYKFLAGIPRLIAKKYFPTLLFIAEWNLFSFITLRKLMQTIPIAAIHASSYDSPILFIGLYNKVLHKKIPLMLHEHGSQTDFSIYESRSVENGIRALLEQFCANVLSTAIVACSKTTERRTVARFPHIRHKLYFIPNFINIREFQDADTRLNKHNLVFIGRLEYRKGVDVLLNAFVKLATFNRKLKLFLIGDDGYPFRYKNKRIDFNTLLAMKGIDSHIRQRIVRIARIDTVPSLVKTLQALKGIAVFPSRYEPFGFVTIEAMALGYIVVASSTGGGKEIINTGIDGYVCNPTTVSLCTTITKILHLPSNSQRLLTIRAKQKISTIYDIEGAKKHYGSIYAQLNV